jgi:hypothetical protein
MNYSQKFLEKEKLCERKTTRVFKSLLKLDEEILDFYHSLFPKISAVSLKKDLSMQDIAILLINAKMLKGYFCLANLAKKGSYCEFQSILRNVYELDYLVEYLIKNPEKVDDWWKGEGIKHRTVANNLEIHEKIRRFYGLMCDFTHPNIDGAFYNLRVGESCHEIDFILYPDYHKPTAYASLISLLTFSYGGMNQFFTYFKKFEGFNSKDMEVQKNQLSKKVGKKIEIWNKYCDDPKNKIFPIQRY